MEKAISEGEESGHFSGEYEEGIPKEEKSVEEKEVVSNFPHAASSVTPETPKEISYLDFGINRREQNMFSVQIRGTGTIVENDLKTKSEVNLFTDFESVVNAKRRNTLQPDSINDD
jgi:hypothetical protein